MSLAGKANSNLERAVGKHTLWWLHSDACVTLVVLPGNSPQSTQVVPGCCIQPLL